MQPRILTLAMLAVITFSGCVTDYSYHSGPGDYYYGRPVVDYDYYDGYGIGYGYPYGWSGYFSYGYGVPYAYPYGLGYRPYWRYPYWRYPYWGHGYGHRYGYGYRGAPHASPYVSPGQVDPPIQRRVAPVKPVQDQLERPDFPARQSRNATRNRDRGQVHIP